MFRFLLISIELKQILIRSIINLRHTSAPLEISMSLLENLALLQLSFRSHKILVQHLPLSHLAKKKHGIVFESSSLFLDRLRCCGQNLLRNIVTIPSEPMNDIFIPMSSDNHLAYRSNSFLQLSFSQDMVGERCT